MPAASRARGRDDGQHFAASVRSRPRADASSGVVDGGAGRRFVGAGGNSRAVAWALPCAAARAHRRAVAGRSPVQMFRRSQVSSLGAGPVRRRFRMVARALPCAAARASPCAVAGRSPVQLFRRSLDCSLVARPVRRRFRTVARALPCAAARARPCAVAGRSPVQMFRRSLDFRLSRGRFAGGPECGTRDFLSLAATGALPRSLRRRFPDPAVS